MPTACSRCNAPAKVYLSDTPRCESCFELYLCRTFRTTLGRTNASGRRALAVALSAGECSTSAAILLHKYHSALCPNPHALPARIVLIHVTGLSKMDDSASLPEPIKAVHKAIPGSDLIIIPIDSDTSRKMDDIADLSDRHEFYRIELMKTLATTVLSTGVEGVILGTSATRAAANVLSSISSGRGAAAHDDAGVEFSFNGVKFFQPLRGFPIRALVRFGRMVLPHVSYTSNTVFSRSLPFVIERFVCTVADDNPSSIHNVVRVAERLSESSGVQCALCRNRITLVHGSKKGTACCNSRDNSCGSCPGDGLSILSKLCYACQSCVRRAGDEGSDNTVLRLVKREEMRKQIEEFLL